MSHDCGCGDNGLVRWLEGGTKALTRRGLMLGAGLGAGWLALGAPLPAAADEDPDAANGPADAIYFGGPIVTMTRDGDRVEALAVRAGRILAVGGRDVVWQHKGPATRMVDLEGRCLMPGFIDPHSHVVLQSVKFATCNLDPKPIGEIGSIADVQKALKDANINVVSLMEIHKEEA